MPDSRIELVTQAVEGPTVLDLGCVQHDADKASEDTWLHDHLCTECETVIGVDILKDDVEQLRREGYRVRHANVETMDLDVTADTVVAGELIEHIANPGSMLERARGHLRPEGKLILTTPNPWAAVHIRRLLLRTHSINEEHVAWYGPVVLRQLLNRYGYTIESLETTTRGHGGITGLAQWVNSDVFGGTTWVCVARKIEA